MMVHPSENASWTDPLHEHHSCHVWGPDEMPVTARVIIFTFNAIATCTATVGNLLVIFIITSCPQLHQRSNVLLVLLSATDLSVGLLVHPLYGAQIINADIGKNCSVTHALHYLSAMLCGASAWTLVFISYDRYVHMSHLLTYKNVMTKRKLRLMVAFAWLYPASFAVMSFFKEPLKYYYIILIFSSLATMSIIIISYFFSWRIVKRSTRALANSINRRSEEVKTRRAIERHWKMAKGIAVIISCYILAWSPMTVFVVVLTIDSFHVIQLHSWKKYLHMIYYITLFSGFLNSSFNPFLYYFKNRDIRRAMWQFWHEKFKMPRFFSWCLKSPLKSTPSLETCASSVSLDNGGVQAVAIRVPQSNTQHQSEQRSSSEPVC